MNNCIAYTLKNKDCICKFLQNIDDSVWIEIIQDTKSKSNITYDVIQKSQLYYSVLQNLRGISECIMIADNNVTNIFDCIWINDKIKYILVKYKSAIDKENCLNIRNDTPAGFGIHFKMAEGSNQDVPQSISLVDYGKHFKIAEGSSQDIKDIIYRDEISNPTQNLSTESVPVVTTTPEVNNDSMWCNII
jgi:hypothetical protein